MRLFVALRPPLAALRELDEALIPARVAHQHVLWSDPRDWHVTLSFLGEVPDDRHEALVRSLARAARRNTGFPLRLAGGGQFSSRVLWIGLSGDGTALYSLAGQSRAAADEIGIELDQRPLQAHLTIGYGWHHQRDNASEPGPTAEMATEINALSENRAFNGIAWNVDRLWLMSVRSRQSPRYDVVASWELQEGARH